MLRHWLLTSRYYCRTHGIPLPDDLAAAIKSTMDVTSLAADYSGALMEALHNYASGSMGMVEARNDFRQTMTRSFSAAFEAGYADGGGDPDHMTTAAIDWLYQREQDETQNILDLFRTLKEQMAIDPPVDIGAWISDRSAGYVGSLNDGHGIRKGWRGADIRRRRRRRELPYLPAIEGRNASGELVD
jgi:hypothetical protein